MPVIEVIKAPTCIDLCAKQVFIDVTGVFDCALGSISQRPADHAAIAHARFGFGQSQPTPAAFLGRLTSTWTFYDSLFLLDSGYLSG